MTLAQRVNAFFNPPRSSDVAVIEPSKAALGAGAYVLEYHEPLARHQRDPQKFMKYAQTVSRRNPWVNTAEGIISGKASTVPWHLEDEKNDTVLTSSGPGASVFRVLERPNPQMTRSRLWNITFRHTGVCGNAFWYLDQLDGLAKTPLAIYYINPARMRPATDARGNLTGWVLDAEDTYEFELGTSKGIPLALDEVIQFTLEPPDWGYLGHGLVEAAESLLALNGAAERYLTQVMATGGRRGHFIGPKDGRMDDDVFQALVAGLRNVAESPDAAKRNIVTKGPIETVPQAVTPNEVGAMGVLTEMREDIVSGVWKVPLGQMGIPLPAGLNSGESRKYEEASLWQNAIEPRLRTFAETLQFQLIDRWKALGVNLDLVLDLPTFDDNAPAWDILTKSEKAPLTWNEQRALVGLDPLPDYDPQGLPLGVKITMPATLVEVAAGPGEDGTFGQPVAPIVPEAEKAVIRGPFGKLRDGFETRLTPKLRETLEGFLATQKADILDRIAKKAGHFMAKPTDTSWWSPSFWDDKLQKALQPVLMGVATNVGSEARRVIPQKADDDFLEAVESFVQRRVGDRITGINDTTRDAVLRAVREAIAEATEQGLSPSEAAVLLRDRVGGLAEWSPERAQLIARTELMNAYNDAALHSYRELDVQMVEALDGDKDDVCAERNGKRYPVDEAFGIQDHPNGTLDWVPVVESRKATQEDDVKPAEVKALIAEALAVQQPPMIIPAVTFAPQITVPEAAVQVHVPETVVNVAPAAVTVEPAQVNVSVPEQPAPVVNVTPEKATLPQDIRIIAMPDRMTRKTVVRDPSTRQVTEAIEETVDG